MNTYIEKNRGFITSHKLKAFQEDPWSYYLKYVLEAVPPYLVRNPDKEEEKDVFILGQAVDDYLTFGEEKFHEKYRVVAKRDNSIPEKIEQCKEDIETLQECLEGADPELKETIKNKEHLAKLQEKLAQLEATVDTVQLTETMMFIVNECVFESTQQNLFLGENYKKAELVYTLKGMTLPVRCELDHRSEDFKTIRDIKTCANLDNFDPAWYVFQMSFYQWINEEITGERAEVYLDVIEKASPSRPFSRSKVFKYSNSTLLEQRGQFVELLFKLQRSHDSGIFPKPTPEIAFKSEYYGHDGYGRSTEVISY